jgi:hypothetical protein
MILKKENANVLEKKLLHFYTVCRKFYTDCPEIEPGSPQ